MEITILSCLSLYFIDIIYFTHFLFSSSSQHFHLLKVVFTKHVHTVYFQFRQTYLIIIIIIIIIINIIIIIILYLTDQFFSLFILFSVLFFGFNLNILFLETILTIIMINTISLLNIFLCFFFDKIYFLQSLLLFGEKCFFYTL